MQFVWMGFLKSAEPVPPDVQIQTTAFIGQPYIEILSVGALRDKDGRRAGMMMIFEVDSREAAEKFVEGSPFRQAGLYQDYRLFEFANEVG